MFLKYYDYSDLVYIYGYGCYCLNLGDRPLSGQMTGVLPVDGKDRHCFEYHKEGIVTPKILISTIKF